MHSFVFSLFGSALFSLVMGAPTNSISSHVLDISLGKPANGVAIKAFKQDGNDWKLVGEHVTDVNGRVPWVMESTGTELTNGVYKIHFDIGAYYNKENIETFYPHAEVVFEIKDATKHYHVPLTLSPYGYSTYKGQ